MGTELVRLSERADNYQTDSERRRTICQAVAIAEEACKHVRALMYPPTYPGDIKREDKEWSAIREAADAFLARVSNPVGGGS